ncbi:MULTISPECIES: extracellular solute-binding protein [unclassified Planococcus (in: firmicutes)]|uniref:extracellular solute-binding protein n=1 Tax=unclassified Planococcus (in: firmicutes) TaxID=2662419 RepID=UPI001F161A28|nr:MULTISPECIES: extracellular solute-binding protein [unclassified Planococcus (in: firmicutes)]UJF27483.1 extracellular solute-binding protein [Planococcus sp. 107-1]GKW47112.1 ABC transporter substrate-binding protein [Planococcus sp. NCCP-2050]
MKRKKTLALLLSAAISSLLLVGCSDSDEASSGSSNADTEIKFMHLWPEGSSKKHYDVVNDIIADYEAENEGVKIDLEVLSNEQYKDKLRVLSTSKELPDVGLTWAAGFLEPYVGGNMFAPLDDVIESELSDAFVPGTAEAYALDGTTYGLPLELNIVSIYYNEKMFKDNGIEVPETYEELLEASKAFRDEGIQPIALGNRDSWTGSMWYMYLADRIGGADTLNKAIDRSGSFEDPALIEAAAEVQNLVDSGAFVDGFNGLADEEAKSMFMSEQAPMYMIATWDLPNFTTNEDVPQEFRDSVKYMNFPTVDGQGDMNSFVGGPGVGLFVAEDSDVKEEAKDFSAYFVKEWGEKAVEEAGVIPATKVDAASMDLPQMYIDILEELNQASNITMFADVQLSPEVATVHLDAIQALFGNEMTPEEFAKAHEDALSK